MWGKAKPTLVVERYAPAEVGLPYRMNPFLATSCHLFVLLCQRRSPAPLRLRASPAWGLYDAMRGGIILVILGITAAVAYSVGRQNVRTISAPASVTATQTALAKPVAFGGTAQAPATAATSRATNVSTPSTKADASDKPARQDNKRKVEVALTAAAIAAIIVQASRNQYYATGRPCACPDDSMRNGRACGARSAYSRPGGASPLCYPSDVTAAMIEAYRQRLASR